MEWVLNSIVCQCHIAYVMHIHSPTKCRGHWLSYMTPQNYLSFIKIINHYHTCLKLQEDSTASAHMIHYPVVLHLLHVIEDKSSICNSKLIQMISAGYYYHTVVWPLKILPKDHLHSTTVIAALIKHKGAPKIFKRGF